MSDVAPVARGTSQTSVSDTGSPTADYATWLTKDQAAAAIGVTTKTIERLTQDGQIQSARWQPQGRGPQRVVYHPDDVARLAQARRQGPLPPFVLPVPKDVTPNGNGHHGQALAHAATSAVSRFPDIGPGADLLHILVAAAQRVLSETSQTRPAYVDKTEALAIAGVSYGALRDAVRAGEVKQRGRRYRRTDLEAL
jgi:hypothetical protein